MGQLQQAAQAQWQSPFLERLARKTACTLHKDSAKEQARAYAKEPGRAVAYWSIGSQAWRMGRLRGALNQADVEEEAKRYGGDTKKGEERARAYLKGDCVWLEYAEGADLGIVAVPVNAMVAAATCVAKNRTLFFLDVDLLPDTIPEGEVKEHRRFHLSSLGEGLQDWAQCEMCWSWRKVSHETYLACTAEEASFFCEGETGCKSPFDTDELRFAPANAPARENKRVTRGKR